MSGDSAPDPGVTFVGDVHGWAGRLDAILARASGPLVFLGDLIDRGPAAPRVLDAVRRRCASGDRCLMGNHEYQLVRALGAPAHGVAGDAAEFVRWRDSFTGISVMTAYGVRDAEGLRRALGDHLDWLAGLPWVLRGEGWIAVHGGLCARRGWGEQCAALEQGWRREAENVAALFDKRRAREVPADLPAGWVVVSGHTPVARVDVRPGRILCDTSGGLPGRCLSAVHWPSGTVIESG